MIILNLGIPRSGTVWAFNACCKIWEAERISYGTVSPNTQNELDGVIDALDPAQNLIVHSHDVTTKVMRIAQSNAVRPFFNYRDPRDVVVSQMRLHDVAFDVALGWTIHAYRQFELALGLPGIMIIPYNHIADHAEALIFQMATKLGVLLNLEQVQRIAQETSYERHHQVMDEMNRGDLPDSESRIGEAFTWTRTVRFDRRHLITDRHMQSGVNGRWREELTAQQQADVQHAFAALVGRLGFDVSCPA